MKARLAVALLLGASAAASPPTMASADQAEPAPRIALITMAPGSLYWTRFGHNALLVVDPQDGRETMYNFGIFDFDQPGFLARFVRGHMRYRLAAMPAAWDLPHYVEDGREVVVQWLNLPPDSARSLTALLVDNARPANAEYDYHYFLDNCSTRVRDALDRALDGALRAQTVSRSRGFTWRAHAARLAAADPWLWLGIDLGLGPRADQRLSVWDEMFIPMALRDSLREVSLPLSLGGSALVTDEMLFAEGRHGPPAAMPPDPWLPFLAGGLGGGALAWLVLGGMLRWRPLHVTLSLAAMLFWLAAGLAGCAMLALWWLTDHAFAYRNENLFLLNPLTLLLLPAAWRLLRGRAATSRQLGTATLVAGLAAAGLVLKGLPFFVQANGHWIALLLPIHAGLAAALLARFRAAT